MKCKILLLLLLLLFTISCKQKAEKGALLVYCAAVVKPVLEEISRDYYAEKGVQIDVQYGGSGTLLANMRVSGKGDLYIPADGSYIEEALSFGLITESKALVPITPVIAVAKGNPKAIKSLDDLYNSSYKLGIANPDAASIGRLTKQMFVQNGTWNAIKSNVYVQMPTVSDVANAIKLKTIDVGVVWNVTVHQYQELEVVPIDYFTLFTKYVSAGVLKSSAQPEEASRFLAYLSTRDKSAKTFKKYGYPVY
ncbi:molybdate ABC transporter substrate-binding protein [Cellulophaga sp. F20128]|uniref:molybdate ABC transporter substrate-binding protein n=1 Tax=Cellulophaga sp. F20128 TaxID=2926413 RepID=UPI001FF23BA1|nr:molybdate ABC transporter substrate-binding protein [Cellulophaga sp. F20128]MCK0158051.1 molybdate ABC transporter substrate-binding protein [Cellulophaga sp. F20128]